MKRSHKMKARGRRGLSLIEVAVAMLMLSIVVLGTLAYRYHTYNDTWRARVDADAAQTAWNLLQTWRGLGGAETFDPAAAFPEEMTVTGQDEGPEPPEDYDLAGRYRIRQGDVDCIATLSRSPAAVNRPRIIHVSLSWVHAGGQWNADAAAEPIQISTYMPY